MKTSQPSPQLHALECKIRCVGNSRANFTLGSKHRRVAEFMTRFRNICTLPAIPSRQGVHAPSVSECARAIAHINIKQERDRRCALCSQPGGANRPYQLISRLISDLCNHQTCNNNVINNQFSSRCARAPPRCACSLRQHNINLTRESGH